MNREIQVKVIQAALNDLMNLRLSVREALQINSALTALQAVSEAIQAEIEEDEPEKEADS